MQGNKLLLQNELLFLLTVAVSSLITLPVSFLVHGQEQATHSLCFYSSVTNDPEIKNVAIGVSFQNYKCI